MPVWRLEDDCLAPERSLKIEYNGPNPFKIYSGLKTRLRKVFEIGSVNIWERDFRWDTTSDPHGFYIRVYVNKGFDQHTKALIEITMQGKQPSDERKNGKITIYLGGRLITEYKLKTIFQRSPLYKGLRWLYHKIFYNKIRRSYLIICRERIERLWKELREELGMPLPKEVI